MSARPTAAPAARVAPGRRRGGAGLLQRRTWTLPCTTTTTTTGEPPAVCGDGVVDPDTETCDDGNRDVDVASDPWGNLAVVWSACGAPADEQPHCRDLASVSRFRWFRSDLVPHTAAPAEVTTRMGMPRPLSLVVAPDGVAAVSRVEGDNVLVHMSPVQCSP